MPRISKLDAAQRTLEEGIRLFFEGRDEIAIHSLAAAAHGVLRDIARNRKLGFTGILHDYPTLRPDLRADWIKMLNEPRNFFKHADKDPEGEIEFDGVLNEILLLDAVALSASVLKTTPIEASVYAAWFELMYPTFSGVFPGNQVLESCRLQQLSPNDRAAFRRLCDAAPGHM